MLADDPAVEQILAILNQALAADEKSITELFQFRVPINKKKMDGVPAVLTVQGELGVLGLINSILRKVSDKTYTYGPVAIYMNNGKIEEFVFRGKIL